MGLDFTKGVRGKHFAAAQAGTLKSIQDIDYDKNSAQMQAEADAPKADIAPFRKRAAPPLTPEPQQSCDLVQLEKDCRAYRAHRAVQDEAKTAADSLQAKITALVTQHGFVPTNAEKSRRLQTPEFIATVTIGTSVEINDDKVTELELVMSQARITKLFPQLFVRRVEYSLAATAAKVMESTKWPKRYAERITLLYALAFKTKPKAPGLSVESRAAIEERARQLEAKAAKRAKKGGK